MGNFEIPPVTDIPPAALEFLEYFEDHQEAQEPYVATYLHDGLACFAALQHVAKVPWLVTGVLRSAPITGDLQLGQVTIQPWRHEREVTPDTVNKIRVAEIRDSAIRDFLSAGETAEFRPFASDPDAVVTMFPPGEEDRRRELLAFAARPYARGRRGFPESHWRRVALSYLEICATATRKTNTYVELAKRLMATEGQAKSWVKEARRRKYLLPGRSGVTGAAPGPKLVPFMSPNRRQKSTHEESPTRAPPGLLDIPGLGSTATGAPSQVALDGQAKTT